MYPEIKKVVDQMPHLKDEDAWKRHELYTRSWNNNALALVTGAGVDLKFTEALSLRTALGYSRTWNAPINDVQYHNSVQFSSGLILNMGTW
jgi:hypothetical protein